MHEHDSSSGSYMSGDVDFMIRVDCMTRIRRRHLADYAVISFLRSLVKYGSPDLSPDSGFEHPASTLPTRFPAALGIGHGLPAA